MKSIKKYLVVLLVFILAFSFVSCEMANNSLDDLIKETEDSSSESAADTGSLTFTVSGNTSATLPDTFDITLGASATASEVASYTATKNAYGTYTITDIPVGTYYLIFSAKEGTSFFSGSYDVTITKDASYSMAVIPYVIDDFSKQNVTSTDTANVTITGYTGPETTLYIPNVITAEQVIAIGNTDGTTAVSLPSTVTEIIVPSSVTEIKGGAFSGNNTVTSATFYGAMTSVASDAFSGWTSGQTIHFPNITDRSVIKGWNLSTSATIRYGSGDTDYGTSVGTVSFNFTGESFPENVTLTIKSGDTTIAAVTSGNATVDINVGSYADITYTSSDSSYSFSGADSMEIAEGSVTWAITIAVKDWYDPSAATGTTYTIKTAAQFAQFLRITAGTDETYDLADDFSGDTVVLDPSISSALDLSGYTFTTVGSFAGTLNGNNKTISGLTVTSSGYAGMFADLTGTVKDLKIESATITGNSYAGVIAGSATGSAASISGVEISNSEVSGDTTGGIAGMFFGTSATEQATISSCTLTDVSVESGYATGGIAGITGWSSISGCTVKLSSGSIVNNGSDNGAAGIAGWVTQDASITKCNVTLSDTGKISTDTSVAAGIASFTGSNITITGCAVDTTAVTTGGGIFMNGASSNYYISDSARDTITGNTYNGNDCAGGPVEETTTNTLTPPEEMYGTWIASDSNYTDYKFTADNFYFVYSDGSEMSLIDIADYYEGEISETYDAENSKYTIIFPMEGTDYVFEFDYSTETLTCTTTYGSTTSTMTYTKDSSSTTTGPLTIPTWLKGTWVYDTYTIVFENGTMTFNGLDYVSYMVDTVGYTVADSEVSTTEYSITYTSGSTSFTDTFEDNGDEKTMNCSISGNTYTFTKQ